MLSKVLTLFFILVPLMASHSVLAYDDGDWAVEIGGAIGEMAGAAIQDAQQVASAKARFSAKIAKARQDFKNTFPDKPGHIEASNKLGRLLYEKDVYYALSSLTDADRKRRLRALMTLLGGEVDNGIIPGAKDLFYEWAAGVDINIKVITTNDGWQKLPAALPDILSDQSSSYQCYKKTRDRLELERMGINVASLAPTREELIKTGLEKAYRMAEYYISTLLPEYVANQLSGELRNQTSVYVIEEKAVKMLEILKRFSRSSFQERMNNPDFKELNELHKAVFQIESGVVFPEELARAVADAEAYNRKKDRAGFPGINCDEESKLFYNLKRNKSVKFGSASDAQIDEYMEIMNEGSYYSGGVKKKNLKGLSRIGYFLTKYTKSRWAGNRGIEPYYDVYLTQRLRNENATVSIDAKAVAYIDSYTQDEIMSEEAAIWTAFKNNEGVFSQDTINSTSPKLIVKQNQAIKSAPVAPNKTSPASPNQTSINSKTVAARSQATVNPNNAATDAKDKAEDMLRKQADMRYVVASYAYRTSNPKETLEELSKAAAKRLTNNPFEQKKFVSSETKKLQALLEEFDPEKKVWALGIIELKPYDIDKEAFPYKSGAGLAFSKDNESAKYQLRVSLKGLDSINRKVGIKVPMEDAERIMSNHWKPNASKMRFSFRALISAGDKTADHDIKRNRLGGVEFNLHKFELLSGSINALDHSTLNTGEAIWKYVAKP